MKLCPTCQQCFEDIEVACSDPTHAPLLCVPLDSRLIEGKHRLDFRLAQGGMGAVYAATHLELDRPVAIKLLLPELVTDQGALERFRREARAAAKLHHPHVAGTYDFGVLPNGMAYIVMELLEGPTLRTRLQEDGRLEITEALQIAGQVAAAIEAAHRQGVIHRDLTPSNIVLTRDLEGLLQCKVVDFGIAKIRSGAVRTDMAHTGPLVGTPRYVSPEQYAGAEADARSDIYSLGVILYEMLAGQPPFDGPTPTAIAIKHITEPPPRLAQLRPDVPEALNTLVTHALRVHPAARLQSAAEFLLHIREIEAQGSLPVQAHTQQLQDELRVQPVAAAPVTTPLAIEPLRPVHTMLHSAPLRPSQPQLGKEPIIDAQAFIPETPVVIATMRGPLRPPRPDYSTDEERPFTSVAALAAGILIALGALWWLSGERGLPLGVAPATRAPPASVRAASVEPPAEKPVERTQILASQTTTAATPMPVANSPATSAASEDLAEESSEPGTTTHLAMVSSEPNTRSESGGGAFVKVYELAEREALVTALNDWVAATNERDLERQMQFYPPTVEAFYLWRDVSRERVLAEKRRVFQQADVIDVRTDAPQISIDFSGREARMRFRKQYVIRGPQENRAGAVLQELRWIKTEDGWKIASERDLEVLH